MYKIGILNKFLCLKILEDSHLDDKGNIKSDVKFNINISELKIINSKFASNLGDKFETLLFLPEGEGRKEEGGLRMKGYLKFSYKLKSNDWYLCNLDGKPVKQAPTEIQDSIKKYIQSIKHKKPKIDTNTIAELPLITVITVVLNSEKHLEKTIQSVINQTYPNIEYIIVDGGSTDGTINIIKKYENYIDYWTSEKDKGIYDAMNKGIVLSTGRFIIFINSGDILIKPDVLEPFLFLTGEEIILGDVKYKSGKIHRSTLDRRIYFENTIHHQGAFYSIKCFKNLGLFNASYKILADYDFNLRLYTKAEKFRMKKIDTEITICEDYGISYKPKIQNYIEESIIRLNYIKPKFLCYPLSIYSLGRYIAKRIMLLIRGK